MTNDLGAGGSDRAGVPLPDTGGSLPSPVQHRVLDPTLQERHEFRLAATTKEPMALLVESAAALVRRLNPGNVVIVGPHYSEMHDEYVMEVFIEDAQVGSA